MDAGRLATPSGVAAILAAYGLSPRKGLGQHFLVDRHIVEKILAAAQLGPEDTVLEIGPGLGVLTQEMAARAGRVIAVEVDAGLVRWLNDLFTGCDRVRIVHGDARTVDLKELLSQHPPGPGGSAKAVANLPYYVTTPLLLRLLEEPLSLSIIVVMVQKEVARRLAAAPGGKDYGALSVAAQLRAEIELVCTVPARVFFPAPDVESAVVRLTVRSTPQLGKDPQVLFALVRAAFGQRRKTLRNALRRPGMPWPAAAVPAALDAAGIDGGRRGETLSAGEFVRLADSLIAADDALARDNRESAEPGNLASGPVPGERP
ncbi:MAG: 16S rRNA (adenine(1518)-N(6)/adenine(1519)-N(6))-dimethyltransferase RsmA [Firmicutes bacterium]|nr:16S rRNA (adenine(1518)-N(6)/adenine(1519)-N(6))-dimethyltransferase RsmA [Bacillota bacterium]